MLINAMILICISALRTVSSVSERFPEQKCEFDESVNISDRDLIEGDSIRHNNVLYTNDNYYIEYKQIIGPDGNVTTEKHIRGCLCKVMSCIRLCNNSIDLKSSEIVIKNYDKSSLMIDTSGYGVLPEKRCEGYQIPLSSEKHVALLKNGSILLEIDHNNYTIDFNDYCFYVDNTTAFVMECYREMADNKIHTVLNLILIAMSILSLIIILVVLVIAREQRTLHKKNIMCYVSSLALLYSLLFYQLFKNEILRSDLNKIDCKLTGYILYFSGLTSFFWLNVLCYEIYESINVGAIRDISLTKQFRLYLAYGFGIPALLTCFILMIDNTELFYFIPKSMRPNIGVEIDKTKVYECYLSTHGKWVRFLYFYIFTLFILVANLYFFIKTGINIYYSRRNELEMFQRNNRRRFYLYFKLFLLMGLSWITELITYLWRLTDTVFEWIIQIADAINYLQGVLILIFFIAFNRNIRKDLNKSWRHTRRQISNSISSALPSPSINFSLSRISAISVMSRSERDN